jgi:hypothetical protein
MVKFRRLRWAGFVVRMDEGRSAFKILTGTPTGKRPLGNKKEKRKKERKKERKEVNTMMISRAFSSTISNLLTSSITINKSMMNFMKLPWNRNYYGSLVNVVNEPLGSTSQSWLFFYNKTAHKNPCYT